MVSGIGDGDDTAGYSLIHTQNRLQDTLSEAHKGYGGVSTGVGVTYWSLVMLSPPLMASKMSLYNSTRNAGVALSRPW